MNERSNPNGMTGHVRRLLAALRVPTRRVMRVAGRFSAVSRYTLDLVLWSRILARPTELARHSAAMRSRGVQHSAPTFFLAGNAELGATWEAGFSEVYRLLLANLQVPDLISARRYGRPSPAFQGVYLWDSAFIAQVWKPWDLDVAFDCCFAVLDQIDTDGRLPHVTTHLVESAFTQPPLIAWSLRELAAWAAPEAARARLGEAFERLVTFNAWLSRERQLSNGLFFWAHPYESGVENAPRFSSRDERTLADTTHYAAPDLCAYMVIQNESLADIARILSNDHDAARFRAQAQEIRTGVNEKLWHEEDGAYYDLDMRTGAHIRSMTIASLLPLWGGIPDPQRAARLMQHVTDPARFATRLPLPSVSKHDPDFSKDMWRGSTWINTAYAVLLGICRYGYSKEAADIAYRIADGVYQTHHNQHRVYEFYDPDGFGIAELHRKRGNRWKHFTLGNKPRGEFVGWSGLVNTIVIERLIGCTREEGRWALRPNLPESATGEAFIVRLPSEGQSIEVERLNDGRTRCVVRIAHQSHTVTLEEGEAVFIDELRGQRGERES